MKKYIWSGIIVAVILIVGAFLLGKFVFPSYKMTSLPAPELAEGQRGELGIDKNINEATIDNYLGRSDAVYRDLRMLKDPGNYEAIGGDVYLSGFVDGFEVVPYPYIVNVEGLPEAVGDTYKGETLFTFDGSNYTANYKESMQILEDLFPKDKIIFLMCGGGGYSGMMKNMLVALGWDANKIYDVGGYWFYEGKNNVKVKRVLDDGSAVYDFYKVPYHTIDFDVLTEK
jgi:rhodanese-related sulfurtransferase